MYVSTETPGRDGLKSEEGAECLLLGVERAVLSALKMVSQMKSSMTLIPTGSLRGVRKNQIAHKVDSSRESVSKSALSFFDSLLPSFDYLLLADKDEPDKRLRYGGGKWLADTKRLLRVLLF